MPILFDLLYPSMVAIIIFNLALYVGYIEHGQFNDLFPPFMTNFFAHLR